MGAPPLFVALGGQHYRIQRPFGDLQGDAGRVTDVSCGAQGNVFVAVRNDPYVNADLPSIFELLPTGTMRAAWGAEIADAHMATVDNTGSCYVVDRDAHEVVIFDVAGNRIGGIGARHRPGVMFNHPADVAIAPDGRVYVSDGYGASRIHVFDSSHRPEYGWGYPGSGPGGFSNPHSIALLSDSRVLVADRENNRLQVFEPDGTFVAAWENIYKPISIFVDQADLIYVTDESPRLLLFRSDGERIGLCRPTANAAHGVTGDAHGNLYLAEGNPSQVTKLVRID